MFFFLSLNFAFRYKPLQLNLSTAYPHIFEWRIECIRIIIKRLKFIDTFPSSFNLHTHTHNVWMDRPWLWELRRHRAASIIIDTILRHKHLMFPIQWRDSYWIAISFLYFYCAYIFVFAFEKNQEKRILNKTVSISSRNSFLLSSHPFWLFWLKQVIIVPVSLLIFHSRSI